MTKEQMEQIVHDNMQKIYLYCLSKLEKIVDAEDVASDIVTELLQSYERIQSDEAVYGYMWTVTRNLCNNYWRRKNKYEYQEIPDNYMGQNVITPESEYIHNEEITLLRRELSILSDKYRQVMVNYYIHGNGCEEIADKMHMSVSNVKQYLFEGRKKVKDGMSKNREYGVYSYAPEKFQMNFWGESSNGYWQLFERKLPGSIMLALFDKPSTLEELSMEVGVSVPYLEDEIVKLEEYELIGKRGSKLYCNIPIFDSKWREKVYSDTNKILEDNLDEIKQMVEKGVAFLDETDYSYVRDDINVRRWFVLMLLMWEAANKAESKLAKPLAYPSIANGSRGYVMGMRGELEMFVKGIYGMFSVADGYVRILNFTKLSDRVLNPDAPGVKEVLDASINRRSSFDEITALPKMLEDGFVSIKDDTIQPEFIEISEKDYNGMIGKMNDDIEKLATMIAKLRDNAGIELEKMTPKNIENACEVGSIVSMWSMLEGIIPVMLESGYMTKGDGTQNLTTYYFKK